MKKYVFVLLGVMALGCKNNSVERKEGLRYKETAVLNDVPKATVTFFEVNEDSRCPEGVNCIWGGRVVVDLLFSGVTTEGGVETHSKMCLGNCDGGQVESDTVVKNFAGESYQLVLSKVSPYPIAAREHQKEDYVIDLKIDKK